MTSDEFDELLSGIVCDIAEETASSRWNDDSIESLLFDKDFRERLQKFLNESKPKHKRAQ